jgi:hypothetical protein
MLLISYEYCVINIIASTFLVEKPRGPRACAVLRLFGLKVSAGKMVLMILIMCVYILFGIYYYLDGRKAVNILRFNYLHYCVKNAIINNIRNGEFKKMHLCTSLLVACI